MCRPIQIRTFSNCLSLVAIACLIIQCVKSDLFTYENDQNYRWCVDCYCGLQKQPVLSGEYCCVSTVKGCKRIRLAEYGWKYWCPNASVMSQESNSCNRHCFNPNVSIHLIILISILHGHYREF